jgi:hypothetical protein
MLLGPAIQGYAVIDHNPPEARELRAGSYCAQLLEVAIGDSEICCSMTCPHEPWGGRLGGGASIHADMLRRRVHGFSGNREKSFVEAVGRGALLLSAATSMRGFSESALDLARDVADTREPRVMEATIAAMPGHSVLADLVNDSVAASR